MRELHRVAAKMAVGILVVVATALPAGPLASATVEPDNSTPTTEAPPEATEPPVEDTIPDDTLVGAGEPDSDIDGTVAAIAVVGFVLLVGVAAWWMVRRPNPDAEPHPPVPPAGPSDLI
jgi:hypothetical protein